MTDELPIIRPMVALARKRTPVAPVAILLALLGLGVFFWLSSARASLQADEGLPALAAPAASQAPAVQLKASAPAAATPQQGPFNIGNNSPPAASLTPEPPMAPSPYRMSPYVPSVIPPAGSGADDKMRERMRAPALVVDLAQAEVRDGTSVEVRSDSGGTTQTVVQGSSAPGQTVVTQRGESSLSTSERFSARVGGEEVSVARATRMSNLDRLVPQGAVLGAVMETALNSDLPGYARAIVQRDVYSFDGSAVLIPAGSRLIGQYQSGVAQGASRLFLVWTRLIRPDGVSIELGSPATDDLGRGGIGGKVNRHFLQRFGGAILTSVISGGLSAAAAGLSGGSTIIVGSAGQATALASQATQNQDIPPTITTRQGASVRIFVARDLDFTQVGPAR
ncbi:TrbI/VirB10 family protein [Sphingomonas sabuli]|uniref:TrbI/VirB10 family protein n=1 Tax=Sphingomonas sabuli TaxID=2764186 RepID=A0A7G9KZC5_9SPHN|nr:TrbI/VirB10 family protein [Sphingomonas sabuli]QNM81724.1 TrbI/VirB10 family protein [Sphingomonas sabuli]